MAPKYVVGFDIGTRNDAFAVVIVEYRPGRAATVLNARAKRGVSSLEIEDDIINTVLDLAAQTPRSALIQVVGDRTGLGFGPCEHIEARLRELKQRRGPLRGRTVNFCGVSISAGDSVNQDETSRWRWTVGRDRLVGRTLSDLRAEILDVKAVDGDAAETLGKELRGLVETSTGNGRRTRVDHRAGEHDDVFMALALAHWRGSSTGLGGYLSRSRRTPPESGESGGSAGAATGEPAAPAGASTKRRTPGSLVASPDLVPTGLGTVRESRLPWRMGAVPPPAASRTDAMRTRIRPDR